MTAENQFASEIGRSDLDWLEGMLSVANCRGQAGRPGRLELAAAVIAFLRAYEKANIEDDGLNEAWINLLNNIQGNRF